MTCIIPNNFIHMAGIGSVKLYVLSRDATKVQKTLSVKNEVEWDSTRKSVRKNWDIY